MAKPHGKPYRWTSETAKAARPPTPAKIHGMTMSPPAEAQAAAEAKLYDAYPQLDQKRDGVLVTSLARFITLTDVGWTFFASARLAHRTGAGMVRWNKGLPTLLSLERQKMDLMRALRLDRRNESLTPEEHEADAELARLRKMAAGESE